MAPTFSMPARKVTHIFLSHNRGKHADGRDNHEVVVTVGKRLTALGFKVWLDDIDMKVCVTQREREREMDIVQMHVCMRARVMCVMCDCMHDMYICIYIHNIYIWMYIQGNLVDQMCRGIEGTCIFIAIITRMYIDKCAGNILYIYIS